MSPWKPCATKPQLLQPLAPRLGRERRRREAHGVEAQPQRLVADGVAQLRRRRALGRPLGNGRRCAAHHRPRYGGTPWSGSHSPLGGAPVCQNTSIGMPPRGYQ